MTGVQTCALPISIVYITPVHLVRVRVVLPGIAGGLPQNLRHHGHLPGFGRRLSGCRHGKRLVFHRLRPQPSADGQGHHHSTQNGKIYSYSIVASLAASDFVSIPSVPSNEACVGSELPQRAPVITNVSIESTDTQTGRISVKWTRPLGFD